MLQQLPNICKDGLTFSPPLSKNTRGGVDKVIEAYQLLPHYTTAQIKPAVSVHNWFLYRIQSV